MNENNIVSFFKNLWISTHNLIVWFPLIWKLRDFDYGYGVNLFIFYLKRLRNELEKNHNHVEWKNDVNKIDTFLKMYDFYDNARYYRRYKDQLDKEGIAINYYSNNTPKQEQRKKELFFESQQKEERLKNILWKYLQQNIYYWWD